jgi:hypothetical protein
MSVHFECLDRKELLLRFEKGTSLAAAAQPPNRPPLVSIGIANKNCFLKKRMKKKPTKENSASNERYLLNHSLNHSLLN